MTSPDDDWLALCEPLTKAFETCSLVAYPDPGPTGLPWTIGYGATGAGITAGTVWTQLQCDARLGVDLAWASRSVDTLVKVYLTPYEKAALADFVFNEGYGNFRGSTLLRLLNAGNFAGAAGEFARWNLSNGEVMPGLVRRRAAEKSLFLTGTWSA